MPGPAPDPATATPDQTVEVPMSTESVSALTGADDMGLSEMLGDTEGQPEGKEPESPRPPAKTEPTPASAEPAPEAEPKAEPVTLTEAQKREGLRIGLTETDVNDPAKAGMIPEMVRLFDQRVLSQLIGTGGVPAEAVPGVASPAPMPVVPGAAPGVIPGQLQVPAVTPGAQPAVPTATQQPTQAPAAPIPEEMLFKAELDDHIDEQVAAAFSGMSEHAAKHMGAMMQQVRDATERLSMAEQRVLDMEVSHFDNMLNQLDAEYQTDDTLGKGTVFDLSPQSRAMQQRRALFAAWKQSPYAYARLNQALPADLVRIRALAANMFPSAHAAAAQRAGKAQAEKEAAQAGTAPDTMKTPPKPVPEGDEARAWAKDYAEKHGIPWGRGYDPMSQIPAELAAR